MRDSRPRPHDLQVMDDRRISSVAAVGELLSASCVHHLLSLWKKPRERAELVKREHVNARDSMRAFNE
jgi:hypothetical protein